MAKLTRREEISKKHYEKNILLILLGIIVIIIVFFIYAVPLLINFSVLVMNLRSGNDAGDVINETSYIAPPVLNPLQDATNKPEISIVGNVLTGKTVVLYLNGKNIKQNEIGDNNSFEFKNVRLKEGENEIKAKIIDSGNNESDYSQPMQIIYKNKPPELAISSPIDKQKYSNTGSQIKIEGKTDKNVRVTVNGYWAIMDDEGNFSYLLNFQNGENKIRIIAVDDADNKTEKEITIFKE